MRRGSVIALIAVAVFAMLGVWAILAIFSRPQPAVSPDPTARATMSPALYCEFYDFMRSGVVVAFDFGVGRVPNGTLRFTERTRFDRENTTDGDDEAVPEASRAWTYGSSDSTRTLTSPDDAIKILLYGLKPDASGTFWSEAGIRSVQYRNLEGKCRQTDLGGAKSEANDRAMQ